MRKNNLPIGVFDSGLGGLTVLKKLQQKFPKESFIYIGDTAHLPYGNKSKAAIVDYAISISHYLITQNVKLIIVACNTVSSIALKLLKARFDIPIIDVITPIAHNLISNKKIKRIGVIGTHNTIKSNAYYKILKEINPNLNIFQKACPLFVPIIEEGLQNDLIAHLAIKKYLIDLLNHNIELLILGCTHYPLIKTNIQKNIPSNIQILDSAQATSTYIDQYLIENHLICSKKQQDDRIIITDKANNFSELALRILKKTNLNIKILNITE